MSDGERDAVRSLLICADDYAHTSATNAAIIALLEAGAINATTCLVESPTWPSGGAWLRELASGGGAIALGLHLNLTETYGQEPLSAARLAFDRSSAFVELIYRRLRDQWDAYVGVMQTAPDFLDGHLHAHLAPAARTALFRLAEEVSFAGWLRQCRTSSTRRLGKRLVLDGLSRTFSAEARARGFSCNPGFGGLRQFRQSENILALWRRDLAGMEEGGVLMTHPGAWSLGDAIGPCRAQEARALPALRASLDELGFAFASDPRQPW